MDSREQASTPAAVKRASTAESSGLRGPLLLAVQKDAVDDVQAEGEDGERPPRMLPADRQQCPDRAEVGGDDADNPSVGRATHQRGAPGALDHPEDDQHPAQGVEVLEDESGVADEDSRTAEGA